MIGKATKSIFFWIALFFLVRLFGITAPPLEYQHNWRQVSGLMVARNFLENNCNILFPETDDFRSNKANVGMEFPLLNYLHYIISLLFGFEHWYGRLINLIISSLGLMAFYKILLFLLKNKEVALFSTILLASSIWFSFSRKMMPDTFSVSLVFIGIYFGQNFLKDKRFYQVLLYSIFTSFSILSKIPASIYLIVFLIYILCHEYNLSSKVKILVFTMPSLVFSYLWYFIWCKELSLEYGYWFISERPFWMGLKEVFIKYDLTLKSFIFNSFQGTILFLVYIIGLIQLIRNKERIISITSLILLGLFLVFVFKSGFFFYHHNYYIIPFVPVMALVAGYGLSKIPNRAIFLPLILVGICESLNNQKSDFVIPQSEMYRMSLEGIMNRFSTKDDLILVNGNGNPQMMYLSHRKGWDCVDWQVTELRHIIKIVKPNCKFIVINKNDNKELKELELPLDKVFENQDFLIYNTKRLKF
jgi:hypothetical protein